MVTGNDEAHAVLVDTEQFSSTQALVGYKDLASWSEGLDAVQRSLSDVGQQATLAVVKPTGIGSVVALESNVVVTITVKGIDYPGGDYTTALTALTKAAVSRL